MYIQKWLLLFCGLLACSKSNETTETQRGAVNQSSIAEITAQVAQNPNAASQYASSVPSNAIEGNGNQLLASDTTNATDDISTTPIDTAASDTTHSIPADSTSTSNSPLASTTTTDTTTTVTTLPPPPSPEILIAGTNLTFGLVSGSAKNGDGTTVTNNIYGWNISWGAASDSQVASTSLAYQLVYATTASAISTVTAASNSTSIAMPWASVLSYNVTTLQPAIDSTTNLTLPYYFAVLVKNSTTGKMALYPPQLAPLNKYVFILSVSNGNLGGVSGADTLCQNARTSKLTQLPTNAKLKAFLSDGTNRVACTQVSCVVDSTQPLNSPTGSIGSAGTSQEKDWVLTPLTQYFYPTGLRLGVTTTAALFDDSSSGQTNSIQNLWSGSSQNLYTGLLWYWETSSSSPALSENTCTKWTSSASTVYSYYGNAGSPGSTLFGDAPFWGSYSYFVGTYPSVSTTISKISCNTAANILCVQQ